MRVRAVAVIAVLLWMTAGCSKEAEEPITLTIHYPNKHFFYEKYGDEFEKAFPSIELDIVEEMIVVNDGVSNSDIVFINDVDHYNEWISAGKLTPLNERIQRDKYNMEGIHPYVIEQLYQDNGNLYGLAPRIESHALYYNASLFKEYGVPQPRNYMSWEEILEISQRFTPLSEAEEPIYGLVTPYFRDIPVLLIQQIGLSRNLSFIDAETGKVQVNSPEWMPIWHQVLSAYGSRTMYSRTPAELENEAEDPFLEGRAAMQIANQVTAFFLRDQSVQTHSEAFDWGVVTLPVNPTDPQSSLYNIHDIFAIHVNSNHKEAAWEFIKFINGEAFARSHAEYPLLINDGLTSRMEYIVEVDGRSMEPFYILDSAERPGGDIPQEVMNALIRVGTEEAEAVLKSGKPLEEALDSFQVKGQQAVDSVSVGSTEG